MHTPRLILNFATICVVSLHAIPSVDAQYVIPQIGGGQTGLISAPMKHADISFDGQNLAVHIDESIDTPILRPLEPDFDFDPELTWSVLQDSAYNFQYGWNPGGFISLPPASWIWIERLQASPELRVYQRSPAYPAYEPILAMNGDSWKWPGAMTHNVYSVTKPLQDAFEATYRVYLGDEFSGVELLNEDGTARYGSQSITFKFMVDLIGDFDESGYLDAPDIDSLSEAVAAFDPNDPLLEQFDLTHDDVLDSADRSWWIAELVGTVPGDADLNRAVEFVDFLALANGFGAVAGWAQGDFDGDSSVQFADFLLLSQNFGQRTEQTASVPEPAAYWILFTGFMCVFATRHRRDISLR